MSKIEKSFERWKTQEVENVFGIKYMRQLSVLDKWLVAKHQPNEWAKTNLLIARKKLLDFIDFYNESDISMFFISNVLTTVDFIQDEYRAYTQLMMKELVTDVWGNDIWIGGKVEMAVAQGKQIPQTPFFFLNEYKPEKKTGAESDPKGQLLIAMLAAQHKNQDENPIYGCYVNGRNWHFVVLENRQYAVSNAFNSTDDDIFQIYAILTEVKKYIHQRLSLPFSQD